jgi:hypothetical protein
MGRFPLPSRWAFFSLSILPWLLILRLLYYLNKYIASLYIFIVGL